MLGRRRDGVLRYCGFPELPAKLPDHEVKLHCDSRLWPPIAFDLRSSDLNLLIVFNARVSGDVLARSYAKRAAKPLNKMALIDESDFGSN